MMKSSQEGVGRKCDEMIDCSVSAFVSLLCRLVRSPVPRLSVLRLPVSRHSICLMGEKADDEAMDTR